MKKTNVPLFTILIFAFFLSTNAYSSQVNFADYMPQPSNTVLVQDSYEDDLRWAYERMRQESNFDEFEKRASRFEKYIMDPIDMNNIQDQTSYIMEAKSLLDKLDNVHDLLEKRFKKHKEKLDTRIELAEIDQQLFNGIGVRGSFDHPDIPQNVRNALHIIVGKIFHITQEENKPEEVLDVGSGIFASRNQNGLQNINHNTVLNHVFTCAHVLEANEDEHIRGAYFVSNNSLDPQTGLPVDLTPVNTEKDLVNFLKTSLNSFQIDNYTIRMRTQTGLQVSTSNSIFLTKPQYWSNEDIVLASLSLKQGQTFRNYTSNIPVNFNMTKNGQILNFHGGERYFALGYPSCDHYDDDIFETQENFSLIENMGISPLFVTSALARTLVDSFNIGPQDFRPRFNNGKVLHEAPTSKGMSGGPLITLSNGGAQIDFLGCITGSNEKGSTGCY